MKTPAPRNAASGPATRPEPAAAPKQRGRPRSFDREAALESAMEVFWERGYDAASLNDLTEAMGINPPSLYAAFGDKEQLYLAAVEMYRVKRVEELRGALASEPTARGAIEHAMRGAATEFAKHDGPSGCLLTMSTNCSTVSEAVQATLAKKRSAARDLIRDRIAQGIAEGDVPASTDASGLTDFIMTVFAGMAMQARDGAGRKVLLGAVDNAMRAFPEVARKAAKRKSIAAA